MKLKFISMSLLIMLIGIILFSACKVSVSTSTSVAPVTSTSISSLTSTQVPATTKTTPSGNWWDKFGQPKYGGTFNVWVGDFGNVGIDPGKRMGRPYHYWLDRLFAPSDWTLDRTINPFKTEFIPSEYHVGLLATGWEQKDPKTIRVYLREGVRWQNKPPVNGREFVASDVQYQYERLLGIGEFAEDGPNPFYSSELSNIEKVIAVDKFTVDFIFKTASIWNIYDILCPPGTTGSIGMAPEWVKQGDVDNWKNAVGTGPWILSEFLPGVSLTYQKNHDYWGYDERYPQNKIPYIDTLKLVQITDKATAIAALRTGKIDQMAESRTGPSWVEAENIRKTNPEVNVDWWTCPGPSIAFGFSKQTIFNDIRVRQALQMCIDREAIAKSYYFGKVEPTPCHLAHPLHAGWYLPYDKWPEDLKDLFNYNPVKAKELLKEAGVKTPVNVNINAGNADDLNVLQVILSYFKDIGVNVEIISNDMPAHMSIISSAKYEYMYYDKKSGRFERPSSSILMYKSDYVDNNQKVSDSNFDNLVERFQSANTIDEAKEYFIEADLYAMRQCWQVILFPITVPVLWQSYIKGYSGEQLQSEIFGYYAASVLSGY